MKKVLVLGMLLALGCEGNKEAGSTEVPVSVKEAAKATGDAAKQVVQAAATVGPRALKEPLPDGVKIPFEHTVIMETSREVAGVRVRQIMLEPKIDAKEAATQLGKGLEGAGYTRGSATEQSMGFSKGGQGQGMMAVSSGGTHVSMIFNNYDAGNDRLKEGYKGMINLTVNAKAGK
jgi:hypothetical protein